MNEQKRPCPVAGCKSTGYTRPSWMASHLRQVHDFNVDQARELTDEVFRGAAPAQESAPPIPPAPASQEALPPAASDDGLADDLTAFLKEETRVIQRASRVLRGCIEVMGARHQATRDLRLAYIEARAMLRRIQAERAAAEATVAAEQGGAE